MGAAGRMMHGSSGSSGCQCVPDFLMALVHHAMPAATRMEATDRAKDVFKNEKVKLGKRTCTCTFTMETKGSKCAGQAKCDNKCTGNGAVEVGDYSFTLAVKKGKGKISKCTVAAMPTVGPVEPTGSGSGPAPTGSGTGPMPPTGSGSGSGEACLCPAIFSPVCGEDNQTYSNNCMAVSCNMVNIQCEGECPCSTLA